MYSQQHDCNYHLRPSAPNNYLITYCLDLLLTIALRNVYCSYSLIKLTEHGWLHKLKCIGINCAKDTHFTTDMVGLRKGTQATFFGTPQWSGGWSLVLPFPTTTFLAYFTEQSCTVGTGTRDFLPVWVRNWKRICAISCTPLIHCQSNHLGVQFVRSWSQDH